MMNFLLKKEKNGNVSMTSQQLLHLQMEEDSLEFAGKRRHCLIMIRLKGIVLERYHKTITRI